MKTFLIYFQSSIVITFAGFVLRLNSGHYVQSARKAISKTQVTKINRNILLKKIGGYDIVYDCYNCRPGVTESDSLIVYAAKGVTRRKLLDYDFAGNYLDSVTIKYFLHHPFIYVAVSHTHGHFYGTFYNLDMVNLKTKLVKQLKHEAQLKIPRDLEPWNDNGIRIENGKLMDGISYRRRGGGNYLADWELRMIKIHSGYVLKPIRGSLIRLE